MQIHSLCPINVNWDKASMIEIPKPHTHVYNLRQNLDRGWFKTKQVIKKNLWQCPKESKLYPLATTALLYPPFKCVCFKQCNPPIYQTTAYAWFRKAKFMDLLNYTTPDGRHTCLVYAWQLHSIWAENLHFQVQDQAAHCWPPPWHDTQLSSSRSIN